MTRMSVIMGCCFLCACASNPSETTITSANGTKALFKYAQARGGTVNINEDENVRCRRISVAGTHQQKTFCYLLSEEAEITRRTQEEYHRKILMPGN